SAPSSGAYQAGRPLPRLESFVAFLARCSRVRTGTLMCTIIYLERLRSRLPKGARGQPCTAHRIFLAALIVAGKYASDFWPNNSHWESHGIGFPASEISLMERQLLRLLDFSLAISETQL
ncbi:hypothetical protein THASP1DRAFT_5581, partial [Thamnocephalis sphaerospora]